MIVAPSLPVNVMSWPSMAGSLAGTDRGLPATGLGEATAEGDGAGEAAGLAAGDGLLTGDAAAGLAGAVVGFGGVVGAGAGAVVGCAAGVGAQPRLKSNVAVEATPPVMFRTRRTRSRRKRCPSV